MRPPFGEHGPSIRVLYGCLGFLAHGLNGFFSPSSATPLQPVFLNTSTSSSTPGSSIEDGRRPKRASLSRASNFITLVLQQDAQIEASMGRRERRSNSWTWSEATVIVHFCRRRLNLENVKKNSMSLAFALMNG